MVKVNDFFPESIGSLVDVHVLLPFAICKSVQPEKVAIAGLNNVLLGLVPKQCAYLREIRCICNRAGKLFFLGALLAGFLGDQEVE